jgi:hypothetical protein
MQFSYYLDYTPQLGIEPFDVPPQAAPVIVVGTEQLRISHQNCERIIQVVRHGSQVG